MKNNDIDTEDAVCDLCGSSAPSQLLASGWDFEYSTSKKEFKFMQCGQCKLVYLKNRPAAADMKKIYPVCYYAFDETRNQNPIVRAVRNILEARKIRRYKSLLGAGCAPVLDIGCGDGRFLDLLKKYGHRAWTLKGIEMEKRAAQKVREKGHTVIEGDFEFLDASVIPSGNVLILMHQFLEHTRSPQRAIHKARKFLAPNGILSIEMPATTGLDFRIFKRRYWGGYHIPRHFYLFNRQNLRMLLEREGFEVISDTSMLSPVFWIHSLHHMAVESPLLKRTAPFFNYQNPLLLFLSTCIEIIQKPVLRTSSTLQIIARKKG
jgi:SAM-dependent methyltransferase